MPASRFLAMGAAIPALEATDDLRALNVAVNAAHPGERGQSVKALSDMLVAQANGRIAQATRSESPLIPGITPGVRELENADELRAELQRKRAASKAAGKRSV